MKDNYKVAISGSHGVIGKKIVKRLKSKQIYRLDRKGKMNGHFDVIFDLATFGNLNSHYNNESGLAKKIYNANLMRVINLVENWDKKGKLIYVSSSSAGLKNKTLYALSKLAVENYLKYVHLQTKAKIVIVRPFTVIGPGEQKEHLIPMLIDSCLNGTEMPFVFWPQHDFVSSEDFIDALFLIEKNAKFEGETYEVGSGKLFSNEDVKEIVERVTKKKCNVKRVKMLRTYDNRNWVANPHKIKKLGWKPKDSLQQIIEQMVYEKKNS